MGQIETLLQGSIDMHMHVGPDPLTERRVDGLEAARQARDMGMRGVVLKSHDYCTAPIAQMAGKLVPEVAVMGSLALDAAVGGLNDAAVEVAAKLGSRVVWMPTFHAANSYARVFATRPVKPKGEPISLLDSGGKLRKEVTGILEIIRDHSMVLATGHISPRETFALLGEAQRVGVSRMIITHPLATWLYEEPFTLEHVEQLARQGAFIEHCLLSLMPTGHSEDPQAVVKAMKTLGAEHCIMSTDFGQVQNPPPAEGMRYFIATMLQRGLSPREIELMVKVNPGRLLGLE